MNRKKIKVLRRKAKHILVEWLRSLLPEEEQEKVNINTILHLMPKQGNKAPWKNYQNYLKDIFSVRLFSIEDSNLSFYSSKDK